MRRQVFWLLVLASITACYGQNEEGKTEPADAAETDSKDEKEVKTEEASPEAEGTKAEPLEENDVLVLNKNNFDDIVNEKDIILVEFYAPWCGHCKQLAPEYERAAKALKDNKPPVPLAKVDATVETDVASRFEIQGYPTLKIFRKGTPYDYDGPREEKGIVKFMQEQADPNWKPPPEEVITLTKDNFDEITNKEELMLVEFYAPWCGHCKRLAPEYEKAAKVLKMRDTPILLGKVDATKEDELAKRYDVTGYPTLKVFRKGKASEYKGGRDEQGIVSYMEGQVGIGSALKKDMRSVRDYLKSSNDDILVLGVFENEEDPMFQAYVEANDGIRDEYSFAHTFDKSVKDNYNLKESSVLIFHPEHLISKYEPKFQKFVNKSAKPADFVEFYKTHQAPLVGYFQSHTEKRFKTPLVLVFYDVNFDHEYRSMTQYWRKKVVEVAREFPQLRFAVADEESFSDRISALGLADSGEDVNVGIYDDKGQKFAMEDEFSVDSLREFVQQFLDGELKPVLKSQPVPAKNDGPVKVVVAKTFNDIVMDESKDVMVEFYAPWCGHCKSLEPTYKKLGQKYKHVKDLVIAKMDATVNDYPPTYPVEGFPTIYFAPPGKKKTPVKYEGGRTLEGFSKFLEEHATSVGKASEDKKKDEL